MRRSGDQVNVSQKGGVPKRGWLIRAYLWACEVLYHQLAWGYDVVSWVVSAGHWRRWQRGVWQEVRGTHVLEIGCGTGAMIVDGVARGFAVVGVDRSSAMLAVAQNRLVNWGGQCPLLQGDGRALPFGDGAFETVMATFPAGYILDEIALSEIHRVLTNGGRLVLLGMWVELRLGVMAKWIPVFYGRPDRHVLEAIVVRVNAAGFHARWVEQQDGPFIVGVLVAER